MKKSSIIVISLIIMAFGAFISCSSINTESREYYYEKKPMRHGIVPIDKKVKESSVTRTVDKKSAARGKNIFLNKCSSCHGIDGRGVDKVDLTQISKKVPNFKFYLMVSQFVKQMPGWKSTLTDKEIKDLENYIHSLAMEDSNEEV